ncbi:Heparan-alpha-glucosaminide N-acetyltransferase [Linum perenne]
MAKAGYGPVPCDDEMQQKTFRPPLPPPDFSGGGGDDGQLLMLYRKKNMRLASLDAFRGLCIFLMMLVDYGGHVFPMIAHSAWNGIHLADFVMPFFLFIVGVSIALVYKKPPNRVEATRKAVLKAVKLFLVGILLQGGFFHGLHSLTYGVDIERIRLLGILQRISIGYIVAAICEIWLSNRRKGDIGIIRSYYLHWVAGFVIVAVYARLSYGVYVPDWQFALPDAQDRVYTVSACSVSVKCAVRGDVGPACNSAGMIDRYVLGLGHLYAKPVYKNLKVCNMSSGKQVPEDAPSWCHAPFDPEGLLSSLTAAVTCIIGLQFGHVLAHIQDHKTRLENWSGFSIFFLVIGLILVLLGVFPNQQTSVLNQLHADNLCISRDNICCTLLTGKISLSNQHHHHENSYDFLCKNRSLQVDVYGQRWLTLPLEWMGKHSLTIFMVVSSNLAVIAIQGFYWKSPDNNLVRLVSLVL